MYAIVVGYDVCMIHDFEGEVYEYEFEGETAAADDDWCKLLVADRRCCSELLHSSRSMETGGAES